MMIPLGVPVDPDVNRITAVEAGVAALGRMLVTAESLLSDRRSNF